MLLLIGGIASCSASSPGELGAGSPYPETASNGDAHVFRRSSLIIIPFFIFIFIFIFPTLFIFIYIFILILICIFMCIFIDIFIFTNIIKRKNETFIINLINLYLPGGGGGPLAPARKIFQTGTKTRSVAILGDRKKNLNLVKDWIHSILEGREETPVLNKITVPIDHHNSSPRRPGPPVRHP